MHAGPRPCTIVDTTAGMGHLAAIFGKLHRCLVPPLDSRPRCEMVKARNPGWIGEVQAGERILCDHPDASGSRPAYFPADWLFDTVQIHGWTCWAGGDDVYHPRNEEPFVDRFEFPYE